MRWPFDKEYSALFSYAMQGVEYKREQTLPVDFEIRYPDLKEGKNFEVLVWTMQVQRAILQPDKHILREQGIAVNRWP